MLVGSFIEVGKEVVEAEGEGVGEADSRKPMYTNDGYVLAEIEFKASTYLNVFL